METKLYCCARCHSVAKKSRRPKGWKRTRHPITEQSCLLCVGCAEVIKEIWQNPAAFCAPAHQLELTPREDRQIVAFDEDLSVCVYCDRASMQVVAGEPRCSWHVTGRLGGAGLNMARARARAR